MSICPACWVKRALVRLVLDICRTFSQITLYQNPPLPRISVSTSCSFSLSLPLCGRMWPERDGAVLYLAHRRPPSLSPTHSTLMTLPCTPRPLSFSTTLKAWSASQSAPSHSTSTKVSANNRHAHMLTIRTYKHTHIQTWDAGTAYRLSLYFFHLAAASGA